MRKIPHICDQRHQKEELNKWRIIPFMQIQIQ